MSVSSEHGTATPWPSPADATRSSGYFGRYRDLRLARAADGILVARLHSRCGPLSFAPHDYAEFEDAFRRIGRDPRNQVVILTGAGGDFVARFEHAIRLDAPDAGDLAADLRAMLAALAGVRVPVIAAIEGRAHGHPELALAADVILAAEGASFQRSCGAGSLDEIDVVRGLWRSRVGPLRADAFLAQPLPLTAERALAWGLVDEVTPKGAALARAVDLARLYLAAPQATRRRLRADVAEPLRCGLASDWRPCRRRSRAAAFV